MRFVLTNDHTFAWPVKCKVPSLNRPGHFDIQQIDATFRALSDDEFEAEQQVYQALETDEERTRHQKEQMLNVVVDWDEKSVIDGDGKSIPFSKEALREAMQMTWARLAFYQAYFEALTGGAAKGN